MKSTPESVKISVYLSKVVKEIIYQIDLLLIWIGIILSGFYNGFFVRRSDPNIRLDGKVAIVTGANRGIGKEAAKKLAIRGAKVIIAARDESMSQEVVQSIRQETGNENVHFLHLDLASFSSIRSFATVFMATHSRLDILINNAGLVSPADKRITEDGHELCFQVNHLGPFLLTHLLLPILKKSAPSRVVVVASDLAFMTTRVDFDNLNSQKHYSGFTNYAVTKWANVAFAQTLAKQLKGSGVTVNSLHPGSIKTDIVREHHPFYMKVMAKITAMTCISITLDQGSETMLYVATEPKLSQDTGKFFTNCKEFTPPKLCRDNQTVNKMWKTSAILTGIQG